MKLEKIYLQIFALLAFCSCQKEDVAEYNLSSHYLYIPTADEVNIVTFSFQHHLGMDDYEIQFPVKLAGQKLTEDKTFLVEVVNDESLRLHYLETIHCHHNRLFHAGDV